jgi:phage baseplate assembly protein W
MNSINIKFPLEDDKVKNGLFEMNNVTKDALTSNLLLLLLTEKGERYYEPDYGTNLRRYIFEPNDGLTQSEIEQEIRETVKRFIPQLTISGVEIITSDDDGGEALNDNQVNVNVDFKYNEDVFSESGRLELII